MKPSDAHNLQLDAAHSGVQERAAPWPFLYSVVPGLGIVMNVEPAPPKKATPVAVAWAPKAKKAPASLERTVVKRRPQAAKATRTKAFANPEVTDSALKDVDEAWRSGK